MTHFLYYFAAIMLLVVFIGFINEKTINLTYEISLMMFSIVIGIVLVIAGAMITNKDVSTLLQDIHVFDLEGFLMDCVLCFMLFAGSCHMKLKDFKRMARPIGVLALLCTLLGSLFYGGLFFIVAKVLSLPFTVPMCLMFGSIVAPTDPIAATSILKKFGLPKDIGFLIEGESLLNDGVGVALFVCFSGIVTASESESVVTVLIREISGAVIIGGLVSSVCYFVFFRNTKDHFRQIYASLLAVSSAYLLCEKYECSGAIASVVCGVLFSNFISADKSRRKDWDLVEYDTFWEILDNALNSTLYVIMGLTFVRIPKIHFILLVALLAIVCNVIARFVSLAISSLFIKDIPDGYDRLSFCKLLTWGGLRGGLCIALAISTRELIPEEPHQLLLGATYAIVFFTTVVQGLSMKTVYNRISASMAK